MNKILLSLLLLAASATQAARNPVSGSHTGRAGSGTADLSIKVFKDPMANNGSILPDTALFRDLQQSATTWDNTITRGDLLPAGSVNPGDWINTAGISNLTLVIRTFNESKLPGSCVGSGAGRGSATIFVYSTAVGGTGGTVFTGTSTTPYANQVGSPIQQVTITTPLSGTGWTGGVVNIANPGPWTRVEVVTNIDCNLRIDGIGRR